MTNLLNDIKEFQDILLSNEIINNYKYNNIDFLPHFNNIEEKDKNANNAEKLKKNENNDIKKSYMDIYKTFFDSITKRQNIHKKKEETTNQKRPYINHVIKYKEKKDVKKDNNFNLEEEFNSSSNAFKRTLYSTKAGGYYSANKPKSQSENPERFKMIKEFKDKYNRKRKEEEKLNLTKQNNIVKDLDNMHKNNTDIIGNNNFTSNKDFLNYNLIINNLQKEIDMVRKERKKENDFFEQKIKILYNDILDNEKL